MKTLILGAKGNLGSQLQKQFKDTLIAAWDHVDFNFLDFKELSKNLRELQPELIINAAAYNAVDKCETDQQEEELAFILNRDLPAFLADYCLASKATLMHYSTDYVFGAENRSAEEYHELSLPGPINIYGQSKYQGEREIAKRALLGLNYYLIRTSKLFGPRVDNEYSKPSFFEVMLKLAKDNKQVKAVEGELSCFTYTPDLAEASLAIINDKAARGIYHLINSGPVTWYEAVKYLYDKYSFDLELIPIKSEDWPRAAKRANFTVLKNTRRKPLRSWQAALNEYLKEDKLI